MTAWIPGESQASNWALQPKSRTRAYTVVVQGLHHRFAQQLASRNVPPRGAFAPQYVELELSVHAEDLVPSGTRIVYGMRMGGG